MNYGNLTNAELVLHVDNTPNATPLEKEMCQRISELTGEVGMLEHLVIDARKKAEPALQSEDRGLFDD